MNLREKNERKEKKKIEKMNKGGGITMENGCTIPVLSRGRALKVREV